MKTVTHTRAVDDRKKINFIRASPPCVVSPGTVRPSPSHPPLMTLQPQPRIGSREIPVAKGVVRPWDDRRQTSCQLSAANRRRPLSAITLIMSSAKCWVGPDGDRCTKQKGQVSSKMTYVFYLPVRISIFLGTFL